MNKTVLLVVRVVCLIVVGCFFLSYFVISCSGAEVNISGMEAAFGIDKGEIPLDAAPWLLLIPVIALVVLIALTVPLAHEKLEGIKPQGGLSKSEILCVVGGIIGLILLAIAHNGAIGKVKAQLGGSDISKYYHTGLGFKTSVLGFIAILVMPFIGKLLLNRNISLGSSSSTEGET